jgi:putative salt-induced outer membrane protein YdiY
MRQVYLKWFLLAGALLLIQTTSFADELKMKNGDRITGKIVQLQDGVLKLKTEYAGVLDIRWNEIETLQTDEAVDILMKDESLFSTVIQGTEGDATKFLASDGSFAREAYLSDVAAINPDPPLTGTLYSGRINAGLNISDGNTAKSALSSDGEMVARTVGDRWTLGWRLNQEKTEGRKTADHVSGFAKYDYFITEKWYTLANIAAERDTINDLDLRLDMGVGTGYQFIETKTDTLSAEFGISQVAEDFTQAANPRYLAQRWAVNANFLLGGSGTEFFHQHEGLLSYESIENVIIRSVTGFRMPIYSMFTSSIQVRWNWQNDPPGDLRNSDVDYMFLLGYKF